jgi:hypothetical protein
VPVAVTIKLPAVVPLTVRVELPEPVPRIVALNVAVTDESEVVAVKLTGAPN